MLSRVRKRVASNEWFIALCGYALLIAPFGCEIQTQLLDPPSDLSTGAGGGFGLTTSSSGLFINSDVAGELIVAGRNADGNAFFVYGSRDADGGLREVDSIMVRTADGETSFIAFELGRPIHAQGPDGSYAHITYTEVSQQQLAATVELYDADSAEKSLYTVEVDLEQAAERIAETVQQVTGRQLKSPTVAGRALSKEDQRSVRITVFSPLFALLVVPLILLVQFAVLVLGQILATLFAIVTAVIQTTLLVIFLPLFLIGGLLGDVLIRIEFTSLFDLFDSLPPPPIIVLF